MWWKHYLPAFMLQAQSTYRINKRQRGPDIFSHEQILLTLECYGYLLRWNWGRKLGHVGHCSLAVFKSKLCSVLSLVSVAQILRGKHSLTWGWQKRRSLSYSFISRDGVAPAALPEKPRLDFLLCLIRGCTVFLLVQLPFLLSSFLAASPPFFL